MICKMIGNNNWASGEAPFLKTAPGPLRLHPATLLMLLLEAARQQAILLQHQVVTHELLRPHHWPALSIEAQARRPLPLPIKVICHIMITDSMTLPVYCLGISSIELVCECHDIE